MSQTDQKESVSATLGSIAKAPMDPILGTKVRFLADQDPRKMNVGIGAYRTDEGKPYVLKAVREAEKRLAADASLNHEYLPISGLAPFVKVATRLLYGAECKALQEGRIAAVQALSGTGSLRVGFAFIQKFLPNATIYMSNPTWGNHFKVAEAAGVPWKKYRYWDAKNRSLDIHGMLEDIKAAPRGSVILLHACAHNPTGVDPTPEQWRLIADAIESCGHLAYFDSAYQGFATGDLERDASAIRLFAQRELPMFASQSFAKNFGLYNERCGTFSILTTSKKAAEALVSQIQLIIRPMYSNPPAHGAEVVRVVLEDRELYALWDKEMRMMSKRIDDMRKLLFAKLQELGTPGTWDHITSQIGMFSYTGLTPPQCEQMIEKHHVYMLTNGRISMAGVNSGNVAYLARAIDDVVRNVH